MHPKTCIFSMCGRIFRLCKSQWMSKFIFSKAKSLCQLLMASNNSVKDDATTEMEAMSCFGITTSSQMGVDLCFVHRAILVFQTMSFLYLRFCNAVIARSVSPRASLDARKVSLSGVHSPRVHSSEIQRTGRKERSDMRSSRGGQPSRECVFREAERPRRDPLSTLSLFGGRQNQFWTTRLYYLLISMRPITGGMDAGEFIITYHTCGSMDSGHW